MAQDKSLSGKLYYQTTEGDVRLIRKVTLVGLITNLFLSALKFVVGILGASQAIVADAVHSLSDLSTDVALLMGVKYWTAPADADHQYGHRRIEAIVTLFIGGVLLSGALGIGYHALVTIRDQPVRQPALFASIGALVSMILKEILYRWTTAVGKKTNSPAVVANAWHHRSDAISSIPALVSSAVAALYPQWAFIDHIGALVVSILILKVSWDILKPALEELTDQGLLGEGITQVISIAKENEQVRDVHAVRSRKAGAGIFVDLHILVDSTLSIKEAHDISSEVKKKLLEKGPGIIDAVIHIEPYEKV